MLFRKYRVSINAYPVIVRQFWTLRGAMRFAATSSFALVTKTLSDGTFEVVSWPRSIPPASLRATR